MCRPRTRPFSLSTMRSSSIKRSKNCKQIFSPFRLPVDMTIKTTECGMSNAWYQRPTLTICYEYLADILKNLPNGGCAVGHHADRRDIGSVLLCRVPRNGARDVRRAQRAAVRPSGGRGRSVRGLHDAAARQAGCAQGHRGRRLYLQGRHAGHQGNGADNRVRRCARCSGATLLQSAVHRLRRRPANVQRPHRQGISSRKRVPRAAEWNTARSISRFSS